MRWVSHTTAHTNQCTLPLWSIHARLDYSHSTQITDAGPVPGNHFSAANERKKQVSLGA